VKKKHKHLTKKRLETVKHRKIIDRLQHWSSGNLTTAIELFDKTQDIFEKGDLAHQSPHKQATVNMMFSNSSQSAHDIAQHLGCSETTVLASRHLDLSKSPLFTDKYPHGVTRQIATDDQLKWARKIMRDLTATSGRGFFVLCWDDSTFYEKYLAELAVIYTHFH
jgi:hypothetical protein